MHFIHGITVASTDDDKRSLIITLVGEVDKSMERALRSDLHKTLVRQRKGGVIIDLSGVDGIHKDVIHCIYTFLRDLAKDGIELIMVSNKKVAAAFTNEGYYNRFCWTDSIDKAKERLGITD